MFIAGELVDAFLNRKISHLERCKMVMMCKFFLKIWQSYIINASNLSEFPKVFSIEKNFLAKQTHELIDFLANSLVINYLPLLFLIYD